MEELIREFAATIGTTAERIVGQYKWWFIWDSLIWIIVGIVLIKLSFSSKWIADLVDYPQLTQFWYRILLIAFGILCIGFNVADLLSPTAAGIHQLLLDIRQ